MKLVPEKHLIKQSKAGDKHAFGRLIERYQEQILYLAYDLTGNYEDAQDLAQETFIKAFDKLHQFEERSRLSTWLYRITVNLAMDFHRKSKRYQIQSLHKHTRKLPDDPAGGDLITDADHEITLRDKNHRIDAALAELTDQQRSAVVLKFYHQMTSKEIGEVLGCTDATARTHIFRGIKKLRTLLDGLQVE